MIKKLSSLLILILLLALTWWISGLAHKPHQINQPSKPIIIHDTIPAPKPETIIKWFQKIKYKEAKPETITIYPLGFLPPMNFITSIEKRKNNLLISTFHPFDIAGDSFLGVPMQYSFHKIGNDFSAFARRDSDAPKIIVKRQFPIQPELRGSIFVSRDLDLNGLLQGNLFYHHFGLGGFLWLKDTIEYGGAIIYKL